MPAPLTLRLLRAPSPRSSAARPPLRPVARQRGRAEKHGASVYFLEKFFKVSASEELKALQSGDAFRESRRRLCPGVNEGGFVQEVPPLPGIVRRLGEEGGTSLKGRPSEFLFKTGFSQSPWAVS
ncbi:hypothetical protein NDU88_006410 [Pleurodeles waltl]|uniref:Uncharacterized protein n=1 Tax=Pleurodeles waltl TaxID=8319 RepID=A0AAV7NQ51_PLEWA|nr:hypothetical protein NDU88_006410 [Pleurodeles waltl]